MKIKQARLRAGMSCDVLAAHLGVGRMTLWRLEQGLRGISKPQAEMLAALFGGRARDWFWECN